LSAELPPPPVGTLATWGERLNSYLIRVKDKLTFKDTGARATQDGVLLWDATDKEVQVSRSGEFCGLTYNDRLLAYTTATHSAAAVDTAYAITWENEAYGNHVYVDDTNTNRIYFEHDGTYKVDFSCELQSGNSSAKTIYLFPAVNGTDLPYSTIVQTVTNSGESQTVSRSGIFSVSTGDYLEAKFVVDDTNLTIDGSSGITGAPDAPSAVIIIHGV